MTSRKGRKIVEITIVVVAAVAVAVSTLTYLRVKQERNVMLARVEAFAEENAWANRALAEATADIEVLAAELKTSERMVAELNDELKEAKDTAVDQEQERRVEFYRGMFIACFGSRIVPDMSEPAAREVMEFCRGWVRAAIDGNAYSLPVPGFSKPTADEPAKAAPYVEGQS